MSWATTLGANGNLSSAANLYIADSSTSAPQTSGSDFQQLTAVNAVIRNLTVDNVAALSDSITLPKCEVSDNTESTDKDTGAVVVAGGVGIEKNLNVGGNCTVTGTVNVTAATQSNDKNTGAVVVEGGVGIEKNLNVGGSTASTSTSTGALTVAGGVGIGGDVYVGGTIRTNTISTASGGIAINPASSISTSRPFSSTNATASTSPTTGAAIFAGGVGIGGNLNIGGSFSVGGSFSPSSISTGTINVTATTQSNDKDTGALVVEGGVGIEKNLNVGGDFTVDGAFLPSSISTGAIIADSLHSSGGGSLNLSSDNDNVQVSGSLSIAGGYPVLTDEVASALTLTLNPAFQTFTTKPIKSTNITSSTSTSTGALIVGGGVGIGGNLNIGGAINVTATTQSNDKDTGAVVVEGGAGIEKNLNVGGVALFGGTWNGNGARISADGTGATGNEAASFNRTNDGNVISLWHNQNFRGSISVNGTGTTYGTTSDRRLKKDITPFQIDTLQLVKSLRAKQFKWKHTDTTDYGFIAQEVFKVLPTIRCESSAAEEEEPVNDDGTPRYLTLDYSRMVPYLWDAVTRLTEGVEMLKTELSARKREKKDSEEVEMSARKRKKKD